MKKDFKEMLSKLFTGRKIVVIIIIFLIFIYGKNSYDLTRSEAYEKTTGIYNVNFSLLEKTEKFVTDDKADLKEIPKDILDLNGKKIRITGYFLIPTEIYYNNSEVKDFAVSKGNYGCPCCSNWGDPPTIFNSVIVYMKEGTAVSPPFTSIVEVTGTFEVDKKIIVGVEGKKRLDSLFYIKDAVINKKNQTIFQGIF